MGLIVFGSQRGNGADLATHLMNAEDNEYVERLEGRGSIADDTHGAFSEWETIAHAMTKCDKYLYSLSINPDPGQGRFTHEQYMDYIERTEISLGLVGQQREIYKHIKESKAGLMREHYHVVWSRIDINEGKAIHIAFDKSKLMNVTRQFALDHNIKLPDGYHTGRAQADQLSLYEKAQADQTGLTKEERMELITDLWRRSDSASAFVSALESNGYILASGKRPYVLVDIYGHTNALPKLINDKEVRTKDVRAFLEKDFPPEALPSVDEAKEHASRFISERKDLQYKEQQARDLKLLERSQEEQRAKLQSDVDAQTAFNYAEARRLKHHQTEHLNALAAEHSAQTMRIEFERARREPRGIVGILAKFSGVSFIRSKLHARDDTKRENTHMTERDALIQKHHEEAARQALAHNFKMAELNRQQKNQHHVFERERRTLLRRHSKENAMRYRKGHEHMPSIDLTLTPGGRMAAPHKAMRRHTSKTVKEANVKSRLPERPEKIDVRRDFEVAASKKIDGGRTSSEMPEFDIDTPSKSTGRKR